MIDEVKILLGEAASNYTDAQIGLALKLALAEVEAFTMRIAVIKLNRLNSEGLAAQAFSGVSESYLDGYPEDIMMILRGKRKVKML